MKTVATFVLLTAGGAYTLVQAVMQESSFLVLVGGWLVMLAGVVLGVWACRPRPCGCNASLQGRGYEVL